jgi:hypothetical protein
METEKHALHERRRNHLARYHVFAIHPEGNQYLVRDAHRHVHYGVWRHQLTILLETLEVIGKIGKVVAYPSTMSHTTDFAVVRNGRKDTQEDPGFIAFDFPYVLTVLLDKSKGSRANIAESYGYSTQSFDCKPDNESGHYRPSVKLNTAGNKEIASLFLSMSDSVRFLDPEGIFYDASHPRVSDRQREFSMRIGLDAGFDRLSSHRIIGEGMTLFSNPIPLDVIESSLDLSTDSLKKRSLCQLEALIESFIDDMPIKPHTDRKNCAHDNFNILACTSKCVRLPDGTVARMGGLIYFRDSCSHFVARQELGDAILDRIRSKIKELPEERTLIMPHVPRFLQNASHNGIFSRKAHANKSIYFSILVDRIIHVSTFHELSLPRRVELCSIVLVLNGMDLPWNIMTRWANSRESLPKNNLFIAFIDEATAMNNGTICSNGAFRRHVPSRNSPMTVPEVLYMNQV